MIVGNDIASFQKDINWDVYRDNSNFVIMKATEGLTFVDPKLSINQSESRRVNILRGYYHFARPSYGNDAAHEADFFLSKIGPLREGEVLCLDFEETYPDAVNWCKTWLDRIKFMTEGCKPLVYLDQSRVEAYNWQPVVDAGYGLWIAAYTYDPNNNNFKHGKWPSAAMQQWTNNQQVPGISTRVDGDAFFGGEAEFQKYGYHKPVPPPPPAPPVDTSKPYKDALLKIKDLTKQINDTIASVGL